MWLCDQCGREVVEKKLSKPLIEIYGANKIPFKKGMCEICEEDENLMKYPIESIENKEHTDNSGWLCQCGNWQETDFHCSLCGSEPPWGCDCSTCLDKAIDDSEYYEPVDIP